jgi:hypothetical protein
MKERELFPAKSECVCCAATATPGQRKRVPGEPNILGVSMTIYRRGSGKGNLQPAGKVQICEQCFILALSPSLFGASVQARKMLAAIRERLSCRYEAMVQEDARAV